MAFKSYLSRQYKLLGISSLDLFTDEEEVQLNKIGRIAKLLNFNNQEYAKWEKENSHKYEREEIKKTLPLYYEEFLKGTFEFRISTSERKILTQLKKDELNKLKELFKKYPDNKARIINPHRVCFRTNGEYQEYISLDKLKDKYFIQEFENEWSRCARVETDEFTHLKVNLIWNENHGELLRQAFVNGIEADVKIDNKIIHYHYDYFTASAGQMRTDRASFIEKDTIANTWKQLFAGMTPEIINANGGINLNKISAYIGLVTGASERWELEDGTYLDIDNCIVVPDIESPVDCDLDYIDKQYNIHHLKKNQLNEKGENISAKMVNQCDGVGWILPRLIDKSVIKADNRMVRGPWIKGLLTKFDFIEFAKEHGIDAPVVTDLWGEEHDLISENILVVFTESQLKLAKYYKSWQEYKDMYHENNCYLCATNYEEDEIGRSEINYQFLQTLVSINQEEEIGIGQNNADNITALGTTKDSQLNVLGATGKKENEYSYFQKCLRLYPELLRDGYCRQQIKNTKDSMVLAAQSGKFNIQNRRLFVVPDPYAAWQRLILHEKDPKGLLTLTDEYDNYYIWTYEENYRNCKKVDLLRSPHLYIEHCIRRIVTEKDNPELYEKLKKWLDTSAVYTSFKDIASRILQFDFDGDELNLVDDSRIIAAAQRTIDDFKVKPLFYDANKAGKEMFIVQNRFNSVLQAHNYGGAAIGNISNTLTKLWNTPIVEDEKETIQEKKEKLKAQASIICCKNNFVIDAAKTNYVPPYPEELAKDMNKLSAGKMPWFFRFTPNGRKSGKLKEENYEEYCDSLMNRIAKRFEELGKKKMILNYSNFKTDKNGEIELDEKGNPIEINNIGDFNPYMLLAGPENTNEDVYNWFETKIWYANLELKQIKQERLRSYSNKAEEDMSDREWWERRGKQIRQEAIEEFKDERIIYDSLVMAMFKERAMSQSRKENFWIIYGEIAYNNLVNNLSNCHKCEKEDCHMLVPNWDTRHNQRHQGKDEMHTECRDCGKIFEYKGRDQKYCPICVLKEKERRAAAHKKFKEKEKAARLARKEAKLKEK